jgi:carbonic anhydrase
MQALLEGAHLDAGEAGTSHMCRWLANGAGSLSRAARDAALDGDLPTVGPGTTVELG